MIRTKRLASASFAFIFSFLILIAPALGAGVNQDSSDSVEFVYTAPQLADLANRSQYDFTGQPLPHVGSINSSNYTTGFKVLNTGSADVYASVATTLDNGYAFVAPNSSNALKLWICSDTDGSTNARAFVYTVGGSTLNYQMTNNDTVTGFNYQSYMDVSNNMTFYVPVFSSLQAGLSAASLYHQFGGQTPDTQTYRFSVPAGYVAYISLEDPDQEIDINATMFQNSALIGTNGSYWPSNATIRDGASYPTAGTQFPISGAQTIRWFKDAGGSTNLLGQTKAASAHFSATTNLVEIYNPYHTGSTVGDSTEAATSWLAGDPNPNLTVTVTGLSPNGVRMYALSDRLDVSSDAPSFIVSGSNDDFSDYVESSNQPPEDPDPTNPVPVISWTTPGGDPTPAPTPGGENEPIQSASIADILSNFLSRFTSLFTEGFDAIRNLSENAQQFVSRLGSLYAWLPPQIFGVLSSAIILAIIIGVLKVFL